VNEIHEHVTWSVLVHISRRFRLLLLRAQLRTHRGINVINTYLMHALILQLEVACYTATLSFSGRHDGPILRHSVV